MHPTGEEGMREQGVGREQREGGCAQRGLDSLQGLSAQK